MKTKDCTTRKLENEWETYYKHKYKEAKARNSWDSSLAKGFLRLFIFRKLSTLINEVKALKSNYYWVLVHRDGGIGMELTNFSPKVFHQAFDLATKRYWPLDKDHLALSYWRYLSDTYKLRMVNNEFKGVLK